MVIQAQFTLAGNKEIFTKWRSMKPMSVHNQHVTVSEIIKQRVRALVFSMKKSIIPVMFR